MNTDNEISESKQTAEVLYEQREWLRVTLSSIGDAVITTDTRGSITFLNPVASELTGWTQDEAAGVPLESVFNIVNEKTRRTVENLAIRALREGVVVGLANHTLLIAKDGTEKPIDDSAAPIRNANGEIAGVVLVFRDITERRRQEQLMRDSFNYCGNIIATLREPFLVLDEQLRIKTANRSFYKTFHVAPEETENQFIYDLGNRQWDIPRLRALLAEVLSDHHPVEDFEVEHTFPTIGRKIMLLNARRFVSVDSQPSLILLAIEDITERKQFEQALQRSEALAELHQRKDEFLAMLSHELRNPLSAIFNALHILRLQETENPIQQKAKIILERQVAQLAHLVDDLLEVSRVIAGRIQLHQEHLDVRGVVEHAIESARSLIDRRQHELSVSLPSEPLWLQADPTRLEQVVVNLLNNAAKYTDEGGQIWLTAEQKGGEVVLRVRDTGVGIPPELLPRIFDLFTQAERTLARSQGGLGIGLSLVQKLVELHYGTVAAHSAGLGQGSEFIVRLPALYPAEDSIAPVETAKPHVLTSRVLVVDDNMDAADMFAMTLQIFGYQVQATYSGQTALDAAVEYQPDFVLLDIGLPDMNGYEVAQRLRQQPNAKDVWLIAVTGYGQDSDRQRSQEAGFDYHLVKPVELQKLQDLLATLAKQPRSAK